jgi:SAM-dependent methyltransferase
MDDWTAGYVADIGYTYGYYPELNPLYARLALESTGHLVPKFENACELGFGQGLPINFHAAASPETKWWGTDFNPAQAGFARELAEVAGSGARLFDEAFEEFCHRPDVPDMDYIALHGIWSWISDKNRDVIVDFVRRKLRPGGVLYISYNTHPGWASQVPLRDLLVQYADSMAATGAGTTARIDASIQFAKRFFATGPRYAKFNPQAAERLKSLEGQDRHYVAHEYFNRDWAPMPFARVAGLLSGAKMNFACPAALVEHVDTVYFTPEQLAVIREVQDPVLQQTLRDFCINQHFRKDYWVKGARKMNPVQHREKLNAQRLVLMRRVADVKLVMPGVQPEVKLTESIYMPVLEALSDHKPRTVGDILARVSNKGVTPPQLLQAIMVLAGKGDIMPARDDEGIAAARPATTRLNMHLMEMSRGDNNVPLLASPVTGTPIGVSRFQQMFLLAYTKGLRKQDEWVRSTWQDLASVGQRLTRNGTALATPDENIAELSKHAADFSTRLPMIQALQVI